MPQRPFIARHSLQVFFQPVRLNDWDSFIFWKNSRTPINWIHKFWKIKLKLIEVWATVILHIISKKSWSSHSQSDKKKWNKKPKVLMGALRHSYWELQDEPPIDVFRLTHIEFMVSLPLDQFWRENGLLMGGFKISVQTYQVGGLFQSSQIVCSHGTLQIHGDPLNRSWQDSKREGLQTGGGVKIVLGHVCFYKRSLPKNH